MYGRDSWTIKKADCWRIDAFELWCLRRLLRVLWRARRSNQSYLQEISPEYSLEGLMLKLKLQYFSHLIWRAHSLEKYLMLGKIEGRQRRQQRRRFCSPWGRKESGMAEWLNWTEVNWSSNLREQLKFSWKHCTELEICLSWYRVWGGRKGSCPARVDFVFKPATLLVWRI